MNKIRYVTHKVPPPELTQADKDRLLRTHTWCPGFGQAPRHPQEPWARLAHDVTDIYRGDKK